jgi:predicted nuclease of predicted toxin-antitoxin system
MILADENIPFQITKSLREQGFEVTSIYETARGISDEQVIELALKYDFLLLTEDKDFGEWVFAHHAKGLSVLFLRYSVDELQDIIRALIYLLKSQTLERPFFATITAFDKPYYNKSEFFIHCYPSALNRLGEILCSWNPREINVIEWDAEMI